jgi:hypothetical protein
MLSLPKEACARPQNDVGAQKGLSEPRQDKSTISLDLDRSSSLSGYLPLQHCMQTLQRGARSDSVCQQGNRSAWQPLCCNSRHAPFACTYPWLYRSFVARESVLFQARHGGTPVSDHTTLYSLKPLAVTSSLPPASSLRRRLAPHGVPLVAHCA